MATTCTWKVESLEKAPHENGLDDVVKTVHWRIHADDGQGNTDASVYGSTALSSPDPDTFLAFASLDEATVLGWVWSVENKTEREAAAVAALDRKVNPPVVPATPPWEPTP